MTENEFLRQVLSCIDPATKGLRIIYRNGRLLVALPEDSKAAERALALYQPQRRAAHLMMAGIHGLARFGLHGCILPKIRISCDPVVLKPPLNGISSGTCGILLGSPEHRVPRVIASYKHGDVWEVAKIFFGDEGADILKREAGVLRSLDGGITGAPSLLGLHQEGEMTILRMPYLQGTPVPAGESSAAIDLLGRWVRDVAEQPADAFPEWGSIQAALSGHPHGPQAGRMLAGRMLRPVIRHGDFARWNLRQRKDGDLIVLDWEWGDAAGMPGIDLVHYFLQDARLVARMQPREAVGAVSARLTAPDCRGYLERTGWDGSPLPAIVACLAYKQGAGHQDNAVVLDAALAMMG